jgi:hypothetical protein
MYLNVRRSKTGLPTLEESGGGATNTGGCIVVCGSRGEKLRPIYRPKGTAFGDHAIFVVTENVHVIQQSHSREGETISVWRITGIGTADDPDVLQLENVGEFKSGDGDIPDYLKDAAEAASLKGHCYHCRHAHYAEE